MVREATLKQTLDNAMLALPMKDFSGGLNSEADIIDLPDNASPDCQNVITNKQGKLPGRKGYVVKISSLANKPDGIAFFYDLNGARRCVVWHGGTTYSWNMSSTSLTSVKASSYSSGTRVTWAELNGKLYYSDGDTIDTSGATDSGIRVYDPVAATDLPLLTAGGGGEIATPAARVLNVYAGSLILGAIKYVNGTEARHSFMWSAVNDPTSINGASIQKVGEGHGGTINCIEPLSIASTGVSPFRSLIVGKSQFGVYGYKGALGSLEEFLVNCPAGVKDGQTMKYIPGPDGSGLLAFLGTDHKVWGVSGVQAIELSAPIRTELHNHIVDQITEDMTQRFTSVLYDPDFQYILDVGGDVQYVYHYNNQSWSRFSGWVSGHLVSARDPNGVNIIYCADRTNKAVVQLAKGSTDNGSAIAPYWDSKAIHANDHNIFKIWKYILVNFSTDSGNIKVTATVNLNEGTSSSKTITLDSDDIATDNTGIWGATNWGECIWAASQFGTYSKYKKQTRLDYTPSTGAGTKVSLRGYDVTIRISSTTVGTYFELLGYTLLYLPRGRKRLV